jgi:hypothetical protein
MERSTKLKFWPHVRQWVRAHHTLSYAIGGVLLIAASATAAFFVLYQRPVKEVPVVVTVIKKAEPAPEPVKYYSPLTGNLVADEATTKQAVTAVMIENSPDARPQSGLKNSGVVFEAIAEGGITRFLVLYQQEKPQLIGPVRSIRLYDVEWVAAFNASIAHVGGSAGGLAEVRNGSYRDIDQFFNAGSYWRSTDHYAPHNVYTSFAKLDALNATKGYVTSTFTGFSRIDGKANDAPTATQIDIKISSALYNTTYTYDKATNTYLRFQAGAPHLDREQGQIAPSVVVAMKVDESTVMQDGHREAITTIGSGGATIFQNGTAQDVTWHKTDKASQVTFTDTTGKDVPLVRGQTWVVAVPNGAGSISWQ